MSFWLHGFCGKLEGWDPVNRFNHTSWAAIVTQTDRPKSVRNRCTCVIEVFIGFCLVALHFGLLCRCRGWVRSLPFSLLNLRSRILQKSLQLLTKIYNCRFGGMVNLTLPFTTNDMISISTSQAFRSWVVIFHLHQPMAFSSLSLYETPRVFPRMNFLFFIFFSSKLLNPLTPKCALCRLFVRAMFILP